MKKSIAILGSTKGTSKQLLIDMVKQKKINAEISIILSNKKKSYNIDRARDNAISFIYLPLKKGMTREEYYRKVVNILKIYDVDIGAYSF